MNLLLKILEREEGFREKPYLCSEGYPTIGYGLKIGPKGAPLALYQFTMPKDVALFWLRLHCADLIEAMEERLAPVNNAGRRAVLLSMAYQMGLEGVMAFRNMWAAIERQDWGEAADQMLDSRWHEQTPERAKRHSDVMRTGSTVGIYD